MTLPYSRKFNSGRQSEQFYNEELHKIYESTKHLTDTPPANQEPVAKLHRSMWHDEKRNQLKWWDKTNNKWRKYYESEFKITGEIMSVLPPEAPVYGQLWLHNGVLCYYDGVNWNPVKALLQDGSQFSLDVFKNFIMVSPLWKIGDVVVGDKELESFLKEERKYLQGVLDAKTDSMVTGNGTKWNLDYQAGVEYPQLPATPVDKKVQLLVPNIDYGRLFLGHLLDSDKYEEVSKVCIQYQRNDIINKGPSLIHVNPGRITKITKRIVMIDRENPRIQIMAGNTEFYGFHENNPLGDLLIPDQNYQNEDGTLGTVLKDYTMVEDGILLSYDAAQNYDYVLAITYEFSWMKSTGKMSRGSNHDNSNCFYVDNYVGPLNVFVEGYDLEDPYFEQDGIDKTVTIKEKVDGLTVSMLHTPSREYGYIRRIDANNNAVIRPLRKYKQPLLFVNGQAMHPQFDNIQWNPDGTVTIPGGKMDMMWSIVDLSGTQEDGTNGIVEFTAPITSGTVGQNGKISYAAGFIPNASVTNAVLFIDGLLVKKEDIVIDRANRTVTISGGLNPGQEYILIYDKYSWLYDEKYITPALPVGKFTDSLVYMNGHLLCNSEALDVVANPYHQKVEPDGTVTSEPYPGVFNEVKCFKTVTLAADGFTEEVTRDYRVFDPKEQKWNPIQSYQVTGIRGFAYSYEDMPKSVHLLIPYSTADDIRIFAFNTANAVEHPLIVGNILADNDHPILTVGNGKYWDARQGKEVPFADPNRNKLATAFIFGKNTLRVWCNGIRQYPEVENKCNGIVEYMDGNAEVDGSGNAFRLPEPFSGKITYAIELPDSGAEKSCSMEVLNHKNVLPGYVNMYKTELPMFPGRVTIYVNGIRLPEDQYSIMDNHTILIDNKQALIGSSRNYPKETFVANRQKHTLDRKQDDLILVEVRQDERVETTIECQGHPVYELPIKKYDLDPSILEPADEMMIFVNGLYFGPKMNDGYKCNVLRGSISVTQEDTLEVMNHDEEDIFLKGNEEYRRTNYVAITDGKNYEQKNATLTLEWR